jgi:hypothetical protein
MVRIQMDISVVYGMCTRRRSERRETRDEILQDDVLSLVLTVGTFMVSMVTALESAITILGASYLAGPEGAAISTSKAWDLGPHQLAGARNPARAMHNTHST